MSMTLEENSSSYTLELLCDARRVVDRRSGGSAQPFKR